MTVCDKSLLQYTFMYMHCKCRVLVNAYSCTLDVLIRGLPARYYLYSCMHAHTHTTAVHTKEEYKKRARTQAGACVSTGVQDLVFLPSTDCNEQRTMD